MPEPIPESDDDLQAPPELVGALKGLQRTELFVPPAIDDALLAKARRHLNHHAKRRPTWKPLVGWAVAACLMLGAWLAYLVSRPDTRSPSLARDDINHDGRVDILDAFALARRLESGGTLESQWDIDGNGQVNKADVNVIAAHAVSLSRTEDRERRSAEFRPRHGSGSRICRGAVWNRFGSLVRIPTAAETDTWPLAFGARAHFALGAPCPRGRKPPLTAVIGTLLAQPAAADQSIRFRVVDIFIDSHETPLAAYQLEFSAKGGNAKVVGVEGGEHPAFKEAPFYDPRAIQQQRVIIAAFNTAAADKLPKGKTRMATIHLQIIGSLKPDLSLKLATAATINGKLIPVQPSFAERNAE